MKHLKIIYLHKTLCFIRNRKNIIFFLGFFLTASSYPQGISVTTQRYDNKRLGWNNKETILNTTNVNPQTFGLIFTRHVDDQIYAQPLLVANLFINGKHQNVVFIATVNNSVYAFNAEDSTAMTPLWLKNFTPPGSRVPINTDMAPGYADYSKNIGIVGTPVINAASSSMYFVTRNIIIATGEHEQYLHAIDITTGNERPGSPVKITATYPGQGAGSVNNVIPYNAQKQNQRPGLLLYNGVVYIASSAHGGFGPTHGWILGYNASTLQLRYRYNTTADGAAGGIWMSGCGPAVDDNGFIYVSTANGTTGLSGNPNFYRNRAQSLLKLLPTGDSMRLVNFFTPSNYQHLNNSNLDYASTGVLIIPNTTISISGSKQGKIYVVNTDKMGKYTPADDSLIQTINVNTQRMYSSPIYYRYTAQNDSEFIYVWAENDSLKQLYFNRATQTFDLSKSISGNIKLNNVMPGGILSASSNEQMVGTGIIWVSRPVSGSANHVTRPGIFEAFDARDVRKRLWSSTMFPSRDSVGNLAKFNTPVIANGKAYLATFSNRLNIYGLLGQDESTLPAPWNNGDVGSVATTGNTSYASGTFTINGSGNDIAGIADGFQYVYHMLNGNGSIIARIITQSNTNALAKAGVMIRESFANGAPYAATLITPGNGLLFQRRISLNGNTNSTTGPVVSKPYWLKIERKGNTFVSYSSSNGTNWTKLDSAIIVMNNDTYIGLCVSSRTSALSTATFNNVQVTPPFSNLNPIAVINATPLTGIAPLTVSFTSAGSYDPDGEPISFSWNFGDGTTGNGPTINHTYTNTGTYFATLTVSDAHGFKAVSTNIVVSSGVLPFPWNNSDVGTVGFAGSSTYLNGTFTVKGSGIDIWGQADAFQFAYQPLSGDGSIVARIVSHVNNNPYAKACVMIRESLTPGSRYAATLLTPYGAALQSRSFVNGYTGGVSGGSVTKPHWVKILRAGDIFKSYHSADGVTWIKIDSLIINMSNNTFIGLAVCSHNNTFLSSGTFDNVAITVTGTNAKPVAVASASPVSGNVPLTVSFNSSGSSDPNGDALSFSWNFDDGSTGTGTTISHTYTTAGTFKAILTVSDGSLIDTASVTITASSSSTLPFPWVNGDVGSVGLAGSATYNSGAFTVKGSGVDIWGQADGFQYVYQPLSGNGSIAARVVSQINNNPWAKAGVMIRESLVPGSANSATLVTPLNGISFQNRNGTNGYTGRIAGPGVAAPYWVKMLRVGNIFKSYTSSNGVTWTKIDSVSVNMAVNSYIGLAVCSHNNTFLSTVTFDNVIVTIGSGASFALIPALSFKAGASDITTNIELADKLSTIVFPNPFNNTISVDLGKNNQFKRAKVFDIYGRIMTIWDVKPEEIVIKRDLHFLNNGLYLIKLEGENKTEIIRIEKQ